MKIASDKKSSLIEALRMIDISVPQRGKERTNDHVERWSMARLLATLAASDALRYPLNTQKHERPDYLVTQNDDLAGFEITEAINSCYVQALSLPEAQDDKSIVDVGHFKWGETHTLDEMRDISSREHLTALPWEGNQVEQEYAQMIAEVIKNKTIKLNKSGYKKCAENNLIIYVNQILPILKSQEATEICSNNLTSYWGGDTFDKVYVECHLEFHKYSASGVQIIPLNNLWQ